MKHSRVAVAVALVSFLASGCGASPEEVCDHTIELAAKTAVGASMLDREECVAGMRADKERANFIQWGRFSSCVTDATTFEGATDCSPLLRQ